MKAFLHCSTVESDLTVRIPVEIVRMDDEVTNDKTWRMVTIRFPWGEETDFPARDLLTEDDTYCNTDSIRAALGPSTPLTEQLCSNFGQVIIGRTFVQWRDAVKQEMIQNNIANDADDADERLRAYEDGPLALVPSIDELWTAWELPEDFIAAAMCDNEFDHGTAWDQFAKPAFEALPNEVKDLMSLVALVSPLVSHMSPLTSQEKGTCNMVWPTDDQISIALKGSHFDCTSASAFRARFDAIDSEPLSRAAHVVYAYGHWMPADEPSDNTGSFWKFARYCDQVLHERLIAKPEAHQ